jgi:uncharacterized membrane protein YkvA (DUF1232 family)
MKKLLILIAVAVYIGSPLDCIPDFIPFVGWGDDFAAALYGLKTLISRK